METAVGVDTLGSRFVRVKAEGLEGNSFELSTPFSRFLAQALEREVHLTILQSLVETKRENWKRIIDIICTYAFGKVGGDQALEKKLSMEEVGGIFPSKKGALTRARVGQVITEGTNFLYHASPDDLKQQYPDLLNQISGKSEFMVDKSGKTRAVAIAVLQGATYQDLKDQGFAAGGLADASEILARYNLYVPYPEEKGAAYRKLIDDLKALTGKEERQLIKQVLDRITYNFYRNHRQDFKTYCLVISDLCTLAGLKRLNGPASGSNKSILQTLDNLGIPYSQITNEVTSNNQHKGIQRIYYILAAQKEMAAEGLMDPRLRGNDVMVSL